MYSRPRVSAWATVRQLCKLTNAGCLTDQQVWFPVDFHETFSQKFSKICSFIDIYQAGSLTPGITLILFTQAIAQLKDIYRGLIAPISINPGLLQDVFTGTLWSTRILIHPENFQETLLISSRFPKGKNYSSRFPGVLDTLSAVASQLQLVVLCPHSLHTGIQLDLLNDSIWPPDGQTRRQISLTHCTLGLDYPDKKAAKEEGEEEDNGTELVRVSHLQAVNAIDLLMKYYEQSDLATPDDMQPLSAIKRCMDYMCCCFQKQTSICDFFQRHSSL